ncbi:hypothetical protein AAC387_Pa01g1198 [Persea americana]
MERRVTVYLHDFLTFPSAGDGISVKLDGLFRSNVRSFLSKHARMPSMFVPALFPHTWQIAFRIGESNGVTIEPVVVLDVVEEDVITSRFVYCDYYRVVGESSRLFLFL